MVLFDLSLYVGSVLLFWRFRKNKPDGFDTVFIHLFYRKPYIFLSND